MMKYILLISAVLSIGLSSYVSTLPLGGVTQKDISDMYQTLITPATYTFSIWVFIYLSWLLLGISQIFSKHIPKNSSIWLLAVAQVTSSLWLIPWHSNDILLSFIIMLEIFGVLGYLVLKREQTSVFQSTVDLFFGWILVACIANFHIFLVSESLYSGGLMIAVNSIIAGVAINYYIYKNYTSIVPTLVFVWALIGIITLQSNNYIIITSICSIVFCLSTVILYFVNLEDTPVKN